MKQGSDIAPLAALIGDPARARILTALRSGKALTASELAREAGVPPSAASAHLSKLDRAGLLRTRPHRRRLYFSLAGGGVAPLLEDLMGPVAGRPRVRTGPRDPALRQARACYNHLAGDRGVRLYDSLMARGHLRIEGEDLKLSDSGDAFAEAFGIDLDDLRSKKTPLCRECLDWSERRSHLAGSLGRAYLTRFEALGWATRGAKTRIVTFSNEGEKSFERLFEIAASSDYRQVS